MAISERKSLPAIECTYSIHCQLRLDGAERHAVIKPRTRLKVVMPNRERFVPTPYRMWFFRRRE